jgi:hypothetical protein
MALVLLDREDRNANSLQAPIYTDFYIQCNADDPGAFLVHFIDESGETDGYDSHLRRAELADLVAGEYQAHGEYPAIYVEVEHSLEYPYAKYDAEGAPDDLLVEILGQPAPLRRYTQAALVATPSMALI